MSRSSCPKKSPLELATPKFREIVEEVQRRSQAPIEMAMFEVISNCLASVQHAWKWQIPGLPPLPVGVFLIAVGEPSIGKGVTSAIVGEAILEYDRRIKGGSLERAADSQIEKADWAEDGLDLQREKRALKKKKEEMDPAEYDQKWAEINNRLRTHLMAEPKSPPDQSLLRSNVSEIALADDLGHFSGSVFLNLTEGGRFINEVLPKQVTTFNSAYSGEFVGAKRLNLSAGGNDPRLTLFVAVQPAKMKSAFKKFNEDYDGTGFLNRVIITAPAVCAVDPDEQGKPAATAVLDEYFETILRHLESRFSKGQDQGGVRQFSPSALEKYLELRRIIEKDVVDGRPLSQHRGAARRLAENIGRIANGLSAFFLESETATTCDYFDFAQAFVLSHFIERQHLFSKKGPLTSVDEDADLLLAFLQERRHDPMVFDCGEFASRKNLRHRRQFRGFGGTERMEDAIESLCNRGVVARSWPGNPFGAKPDAIKLIDRPTNGQARIEHSADKYAHIPQNFRDFSDRRQFRCCCLRCTYEV